MIWTEEKIEVIVSEEMINSIQEVLTGLDELQDIMYEHGFYCHTKTEDFSPEDIHNTKQLLKAIIDPECKFE